MLRIYLNQLNLPAEIDQGMKKETNSLSGKKLGVTLGLMSSLQPYLQQQVKGAK
jgi:hypothetical protein